MSTHKPSHNEEEYFAREEAEKKRRLAQTHSQEMAESERERLRALHALHCPKCGMHMHELTYRGVQIERCFHCHGIFLDEKDVEKLLQESRWPSVLHFFSRRDYTKGYEP